VYEEYLAELREQFPSFLKELDPLIYLSENYVVVDFETTSLDKGDPTNPENSLLWAGWEVGPAHKDFSDNNYTYSKWGNEYEQSELIAAVESADFFVAHNAKFEFGWLARCGLDLSKTLGYCTQIGEYVIAGNRKFQLSLEATSKRYGYAGKMGLISKLIKGGVPTELIPRKWLSRYGRLDVRLDHHIFRKQRKRLYEDGLLPSFFTRNILTPVLADMEKNGVHIDKERVEYVYFIYKKKEAELLRELDVLTGGFNPNSPKQKVDVIYGELGFKVPKDYRGKECRSAKTDAPKTDADTLALLRATNKKQREFIRIMKELSEVNAALTKTLEKFHNCVHETEDHIITASFNQTITQTHRLSSSGKNYKTQFQNFGRTFKPLISPRHEGWEIGEADEGQLEYRVAVFLGNDEQGLQDIVNKVDAHGFTASIIFKEEWEDETLTKEVRKEIRNQSKPHTFKPLYGGQSGTPRQVEYYEAFKKKHSGITAAQKEWITTVLKDKELTTVTGFKFYWPDTKITKSGYIVNTTSICNYPVQSFATADIVPIGLVYQWHYMKAAKMQSFLINTVHDSTIGEVHPEEKELYAVIARQSLEDDVITYLNKVYGIDFFVPLEAEAEFAPYWADSPNWQEQF